MKTLVESLSESEQGLLRQEFQLAEPTAWVSAMAREKDWRAANEAFLEHERERGHKEMRDLMKALHMGAPSTPSQAANLVVAALSLFIGPDGPDDSIERLGEATIRVRICDCPTIRRLEAAHWLGVTACGTWHRRHGWYEALGMQPEDSVIAESKWGDEACVAIIEFGRPPEEAAR